MLHLFVITFLLLLIKVGIEPFLAVFLYFIFAQIDHAIFLPIAWYRRFKRTAKRLGAKMEKNGWMTYAASTTLSGLATKFDISGNSRGNSAMTLAASIELPDCPPDLVAGSEAILGSKERNKGVAEGFEVGEPDIDNTLWLSADDTARAKEYLTRNRLVTLASLALAYPRTTLENGRLTVKVTSSYTPSFTARNHKRFIDAIVESASPLAGESEGDYELPNVKAHQIRKIGRGVAPIALLVWVYGWFYQNNRMEWLLDPMAVGVTLQVFALGSLAFWLLSLSGTEVAKRCLSLYWTLNTYLSLGIMLLGIPAVTTAVWSTRDQKGAVIGGIIFSFFYFLPALLWCGESARCKAHLKALK